MCLASVYIEGSNQQDAVMQDVAWITAEGHELRVTSLFGESMLLQAQIKSIDLMKSRVVLEGAAGLAGRVLGDREHKPE